MTRNAYQKKILTHILVAAQRGGCERACDHVCKYAKGVDNLVLVLGDEGDMTEVWRNSGAFVEHLGVMNLSRIKRASILRKRLHSINPKGVIVWHGMAELPIILNSIPNECSSVLVYGGNPASNLTWLTDWRYLIMEKLFYPQHHDLLYTCCSKHVARSFQRSRYLSRFRHRAITNGVDYVADNLAHYPRELPGPGGEILIGMLARLDAIKDHAGLIRAFAQVIKVFPGSILELAGDGDQLDDLKNLAIQLGVVKSVRFLGTVSNVIEVLKRWDIFAYATTSEEGFGIALAEALMSGLPSVVTDVGPVREVCSDGINDVVVYVPPHNADALAQAVLNLVENWQKRQDLKIAARNHAITNLSGEKFAQSYIDILFG